MFDLLRRTLTLPARLLGCQRQRLDQQMHRNRLYLSRERPMRRNGYRTSLKASLYGRRIW